MVCVASERTIRRTLVPTGRWAPLLALLLLLAELGQIFGYHIRHIEEEPSHQLQQDLMDFIDLVPFEDVQRLMQYYYHYDVEVESAFDYVSSEDYTQIRLDIVSLGEVRSFRRYLDSIGFSVEKVWTELNKRFDADDIFAEPDESVRMCEYLRERACLGKQILKSYAVPIGEPFTGKLYPSRRIKLSCSSLSSA